MFHREVISIEETSYHSRPNSCIRRFTLTNHLTNFQIIIKNVGGTLISCCKLSDKEDDLVKTDELIRQDNNDENQQINQQFQQTSSGSVKRNQNNPQSIIQTNEFDWQSHVLGANSISFSTNSHHNSTITYQLSDVDNSLIMLGKLRSVSHLAYLAPFYFNLNSSNTTVDGHFLHIKAIKLDKFDQSPENSLSFSLTGSDDNEFLSFIKSPARISWSSNGQDNKKVYELVYKLNGRYREASIIGILSYGSKRIEVTLQNTLNSLSNQISTTFSQQSTAITSNQLTNSTQNHCKLKVIICKVGVAILPTDLSEFKCSYKFYF